MATTVGTEAHFNDLVTNLIYLERDAIAAYDSVIERLSNPALSDQVAQFREDHFRHLDSLNEMAREAGVEAPLEGDAKRILTTGKIALADLMGDGAILKAMRTNEEDTVSAYSRAAGHTEARPESVAFFEKALADETRHRDWMERTSSAL